MSVVKLNEYTSTSDRTEQSKMLAERTQMLINISKKAREESLTLQETNDLYAEFNKAYDLSFNATEAPTKFENTVKKEISIKKAEPLKTVGLDGVDESWAIKLLRESELEEGKQKSRNNQVVYRQMIQPVLCEA